MERMKRLIRKLVSDHSGDIRPAALYIFISYDFTEK